jgi:hypothetical protein
MQRCYQQNQQLETATSGADLKPDGHQLVKRRHEEI